MAKLFNIYIFAGIGCSGWVKKQISVSTGKCISVQWLRNLFHIWGFLFLSTLKWFFSGLFLHFSRFFTYTLTKWMAFVYRLNCITPISQVVSPILLISGFCHQTNSLSNCNFRDTPERFWLSQFFKIQNFNDQRFVF